ncbi:GlxA family transcriptional regulator [Solirhodobacter olei]|uniref:GlxA family transcriptional regulator n=1 Tax=Solirhodobacter olei TaxID=2493082 RepID=UPI000FD7B6DB|nr:GlxA family transcriptional regulator [Solirhodobacter olei]
MAESETLFTASSEALDIAFLVLPQASILEVASTLDPLRSANRHLGRAAFRWRVVSPDGRPVALTCGLELPATGGLSAAEGADVLIVIAGFRQSEVVTRALLRELGRIGPRFRALGGIDAGAWVLARAGLLDGHRATVHWEDLEDFSAAYPGVEVLPDRYVISKGRWTAGGAAPALDMMLQLIRARHGAALAIQVAGSFITSPRAGAEPQTTQPVSGRDPRVAAAIARMEARIEAPEPTEATARAVGLTARRLEGLFRAELGMGPGAYGRDLRLQAARRLVTDTRHPLQVVALRTGFSSQAAFSRAFRQRFGVSASALRRGA